jgi:hypothetical protein
MPFLACGLQGRHGRVPISGGEENEETPFHALSLWRCGRTPGDSWSSEGWHCSVVWEGRNVETWVRCLPCEIALVVIVPPLHCAVPPGRRPSLHGVVSMTLSVRHTPSIRGPTCGNGDTA